MRARRRRLRGQGGFTLVELMISLVLFSFAVAGVLAVAVSLVNGMREQKQAVNTETSARSAMSFMSEALRGASPGVPSGQIFTTETEGDGSCALAQAVTVINSNTGPDEVTAIFAYGAVVTTATTALSTGNTLTVTDASQLAIGDWFVITDFTTGHLYRITGKSGNDLTMASPTCASTSSYNPGALVIRALRGRFYIAPLDGIPTLWMDPDGTSTFAAGEPLAEGVEDLQISRGMDTDNSGTVVESTGSDDEWEFSKVGDTTALAGNLRALKIDLIARATNPVNGPGGFYRPALDDHAVSTTPDGYRRRILSSAIEIRNLTGSP